MKALARREAYPPAKSEAPQMKTAATLQTVGAERVSGDTDERNTSQRNNRLNAIDAVGC